jgi:hypothetical protein
MIETELPLWKQIKILPKYMKKKDTLPTEKLIICEIVFCGLTTRINIIIEIPILENSIRYPAVIDKINVTKEHLKSGTF